MIPFGGSFGNYFDYYNSFYNPYSDVLDVDFGVLSSVFLISLLILLVLGIFETISLYTIAKNRGIKNAFLAFIPIGDYYILGKIYDDISATMNKKTGYAVRMAVLSAVSLTAAVFACVFFSMSLVMGYTGGMSAPFIALAISFALVMIGCFVAASVFMFISLYAIIREYAPSNAVLFLVLSVLIIRNYAFFAFFDTQ